MHILFLTDNFPPEVNAPASRTFEHCREWVLAGQQVTVITCAPNFPRGQVYTGYQNKLWQCENLTGIRVIRVWTYITANEGFLKRILDYLSFMVSAFLAALFVPKVDIVIGTSPQFFTACAAWVTAKVKRVPFVFELRDLWPESIKAVGAMQDSFAIRLFERVEMFLYRQATRIVSVTESFKHILVGRGIDAGKIEVITNGVDISRFKPLSKDAELIARYGLEGKFVAGYIGTHGMAHALETILEAAARLQQAGEEGCHFLFLGDGARKQSLVAQAQALGLNNLTFIDSVPKEDVPRYWSLLDVSIIHLRKTELFTTVIPSKMFECMGMGIPILHGVAGESAEIVEKEGVGLVFEPEKVDELSAKLKRLRDDRTLYDQLQANCLKAAGNYGRAELAGRMLQSIKILGQPKERR